MGTKKANMGISKLHKEKHKVRRFLLRRIERPKKNNQNKNKISKTDTEVL